MKKLLSLITAGIMILSFAMTGCGESNKTPSTVEEISAERIVVLTASDCEIVAALGCEDRIVGRGEYCDYPESVTKIPSVGSAENTNIEEIINLNPDCVILSMMEQSEEQIESLKKAGINVVASYAKSIEELYDSIEVIGQVLGKEDEAADLVTGMRKSFDDLKAKLPENSGDKTVYFEVSPLEYGLYTGGANTFLSELANMLGVKNAFEDIDGWSQISEEQLLERDPDYIVTLTMYYGEGPSPDEEILGRKGWENMKAVKNKAILVADSNKISRPGPRLVEAAEDLFEFFY